MMICNDRAITKIIELLVSESFCPTELEISLKAKCPISDITDENCIACWEKTIKEDE
jgi:hypothetical protein